MPSAACHKLLGSAVAQGARSHWRADFDWTGLRIVGAAITAHGAQPWRMTAADYRHALETGESTPLTGSPAATPMGPRTCRAADRTRPRGHGRAPYCRVAYRSRSLRVRPHTFPGQFRLSRLA